MVLKINEEWEITGSAHNYILNRLSEGKRKSDDKGGRWKKGDPCILREPHYFPQLRQCCEWIINQAPKADLSGFHTIINEIDRAKADIIYALKGIDG